MTAKHTTEILAEALEQAELPEMAKAARAGYYHDFLSPLDFPEMTLAAALAGVGTPAALAVRQRVIDGDFDATLEESEAWAKSPEGQATFKKLLPK